MSSGPTRQRTAGAAIALVLMVALITACTTTQPDAPPEIERSPTLPSDPGAGIAQAIIEGSREQGERLGPLYTWTIEGLPECPAGGMFEYGSASIVSGRNPIVRSMLWVAQGPEELESARGRFLEEAKNGVLPEWLGPWQAALCNSLEIQALVDPAGAGMKGRGGEGLELCRFFSGTAVRGRAPARWETIPTPLRIQPHRASAARRDRRAAPVFRRRARARDGRTQTHYRLWQSIRRLRDHRAGHYNGADAFRKRRGRSGGSHTQDLHRRRVRQSRVCASGGQRVGKPGCRGSAQRQAGSCLRQDFRQR